MKLSKGKIQKLHNTKNQSQRKNKKKGKKRPANHNTLRKRHTNLATKTLKRKNKSTLYGGKDDTSKVGQKFEELIDVMSEVLASKVASKIGSTGQGSSSGDSKEFQDPIEANKTAAEKVVTDSDEIANAIKPATPATPATQPDATPETQPDATPQEATPVVPPKKSRFSSFFNSTRKMRNSAKKSWADGKDKRDARRKAFGDRLDSAKQAASQAASQARESVNKSLQSIDDKKANKIFDDNDEDKSGKLNETEYKTIKDKVSSGEGLTLPEYDEQTYKETYPEGIDKKQFVQLYKTAITQVKAEAKANKIFDDNDTDKSGKIDETEYKVIKDKLVREEGLQLPDYEEISSDKKDADGVNKEQFAKLYKDAAANSSMFSRMSSKASSKGSNVTRKMRDSFDKSTQSIDEKKANKIFDDNDKDKSGKINKSEYEGIQAQFVNDGGFLTLPDYDKIPQGEKEEDGVNKKQFVQLYKTAITEAKANSTKTGEEAKKAEAPAIKAEAPEIKAEIPPIEAEANDILQKAGLDLDKDKINPLEYKKIKHHLKTKGLKLQDYKAIPKEEKDKDGITKEKFVNLYKVAKTPAKAGGAKKNRTRKLKGNKRVNKKGKGKKNNK